MAMGALTNTKINFIHTNSSIIRLRFQKQNRSFSFCFQKRVSCTTPLQQQQQVVEEVETEIGIMCEGCSGKGWLICDFCNGQKTNVTAPNKRIYRRCPSCKAIGCILCSKCKVFKCVTFPNSDDGLHVNF